MRAVLYLDETFKCLVETKGPKTVEAEGIVLPAGMEALETTLFMDTEVPLRSSPDLLLS